MSDAIQNAIATAKSKATSTATNATTTATSAVTNAVSSAQSKVTGAVSDAQSKVTGAVSDAQSKVTGAVSGAQSKVTGAVDDAKAKLADAQSKVTGAVDDAKAKLDEKLSKLPKVKDPELLKAKIRADIEKKQAEINEKILKAQDKAVQDVKDKINSLKLPSIPIPKIPLIDPKILAAFGMAKQLKELWKNRSKLGKASLKKGKETYEYPIKQKIVEQIPPAPELPFKIPQPPTQPPAPTPKPEWICDSWSWQSAPTSKQGYDCWVTAMHGTNQTYDEFKCRFYREGCKGGIDEVTGFGIP